MKKLLRIVKWSAAGFAILLVLMILAVTLYSRTENFERWAQEQSITAINNSIRGSISVERLSGSVWSHLTFYNVALRYEESEIVEIPRVDVSFSLWPLIWGEVRLARVEAAQPEVRLKQDREDRWNIIDALSPREPDPTAASNISVRVKSLHMQNAEIDISMHNQGNGKIYRLQNLDLAGRVGILPAGTVVEVSEVTAVLSSEGRPELRLKGALAYRQGADVPGLFKVENFWAVSRHSRVKLNGEISQDHKTRIKAHVAVDKLAAADMDYFVSRWPLRHDLAGNVAVQGTLGALNGNFEIVSAGAKASGKFQADVTPKEPRYSATAALGGVDLRQWLGNKDFSGVAAGTIEATGTGFSLGNAAGKAHLEIHSTAVWGWALGTVSVDGFLKDSIAAIDGKLQGKLGGANWSGKISLGDERPSYDLALTVKDLDVKKVSPEGNGPRGKLSLRSTVKGSGFTLDTLNARAEVQILPSSVDPVQIRQGAVSVSVSDKTMRISRATLNTDESSLGVSGEIGLDSKMAGKLDYRLRVGDLSPWLKLIKRQGSGAIDLAGEARGNLADLQSQGTAHLSKVRAEGIAVRDGNIKFSLQGSKELFFPQGVVTARLADVEAGIAVKQLDAAARLLRQPAQSIELDLSVQDHVNRKHTLHGSLGFAGEVISLRLSQFSLALPDGTWKLARPANLTKRGDAFLIDQFSMTNGDRELSVHGRVAPAGSQDVDLKIDRLPLETVLAFSSWHGPPQMSGLLNAQARIGGSAAAPEITASLRLDDAKIADQPYRGADADMTYKDKRAIFRFSVHQDATHSLHGNGATPLDLSWHRGWRAEFADGMALRVQSAGLSVGFLNVFGGKSFENVQGEVSLDIGARGSVPKPDVRGTFALRDGRIKVIPLGLDIYQIAAAGSLDSRNLNLRELSARAKDGEIKGSGTLSLKDYDIDAVRLSLTALRWPAIETARYQLRVAGNIDVNGTLAAPRIKGQFTVNEGTLRPDLAFLEQSKVPFKRDETIVIVNKSAIEGQAQTQPSGKTAFSALFNNISMDMTLSAARNVWIRHADFVSELSGRVHVTKKPEHHIDVTGRIDIVRGWYALQGRRFELQRGTLQFIGGDKINPALDIVAQYRLPEYQVEATIGGTADKPSLTLTSQPRLEQADILALLIFGRPINSLSRNEQGALQQNALSISSGYVAGKIASSVSAALGLERLGVDIGEVEFSGGQVGFGRYIGTRTYVTASQKLAGEQGRQVGLEYQIAPDWKVGTTTTSTGSNGIDIIWHKRY